jgi:glycerophosphoryl diester phosphodiesterase
MTHPFLDASGPIAMAHRGGPKHAPENSLAAFSHAVSLGYQYLETDARVTSDGVLVAFHDATLDRVTDRSGAIGRMPWREVRAARIRGTEPIPLLADVLEKWPEALVNIDAKTDAAVEPLADLIRRTGAIDRVCVGAFSDQRLRHVRSALAPGLCTSMGPLEVSRLRLAAWGLLPRTLVPTDAKCVQIPVRSGPVTLTEPRLVNLAHDLGLPVHVWTVDDPAEMHRLLDLGVDGLMTDDLLALRGVLEERGAWPG